MYIPYDVITLIGIVTVTIRSFYDIIDYIPRVVHYVPVTYLFYNWKFVPLIH